MAISSINSLTKLRLTGLSSGFDTDSIIKTMMQIEQLKINRQYRAKTTLQWKQEALNGVASDMKTFRQEFMSVLNAKNIVSENAYNAYKAEVTGKNASAVTISSTVHSTPGKVTIDKISSLAKSTEVSSGNMNKAVAEAFGIFEPLEDGETAPNGSTRLGDLKFVTELEPGAGGAFTFKINGKEFSFTEDSTINDIVFAIREDPDAGVYAFFDWTKGGLMLTAKSTGQTIDIENIEGNLFGNDSAFHIWRTSYSAPTGISEGGWGLTGASQTMLKDLKLAQPLQFENGEISFSINGRSFTFVETDTLGKMMTTINGSDAGVLMSYSELTDKFTFKTKDSGSWTQLTIQNGKGNTFGNSSAFGISSNSYSNGSDAVAVINGVSVVQSKNSFTIDGISYTLNRVTASGDDPIEITITRDVTDTFEKIKGFVDGYNTLIKKLEGLLTDKKSLDEHSYVPLTDDEKAEMTDKQIEQWEAIAKKGILRNNAGIQNLVSRLRSALFESVSSVGLSPAQIGLTTGDYFSGNGGQIELDEYKLKSALESNPEAVMSIFIDKFTDSDPKYEEGGLLTRIGLIFDDYTKGAGDIALDSIEYSLKQVNDKITTMQNKMLEKEERLYKQYAAMESALAKVQSQSDWLSSMLGSMNGSK